MLLIDEIINKRYNTNRGYLYFVDKIKEKYPTFNINEENLKTLEIVPMSEEFFYKTGFTGVYFASKNQIQILTKLESKNYYFSEDELIDTFLHELINALTSRILNDLILEGINQKKIENGLNSYFVALNEGITQYIVNDLLGKKSDAYPFETHIATQLAIILGNNKLMEIYSTNDINGLFNAIKSINPDFNERDFILNTYGTSKVLQGELANGTDIIDKTRATLIQEQLLNLYYLANINSDLEFKNAMIDEKNALKILEQSIIKKINPFIDINDVGFMNIEEPKKSFEGKKHN